tara:strand:- start:174 stop:755 length:582 start_codon:yes stop_codon:yes gene_type:complete
MDGLMKYTPGASGCWTKPSAMRPEPMDRINASSFPINQALRVYAQSPQVNRPGGARYANAVQPMRPVANPVNTNPTQQIQQTETAQQTQSTQRLTPTQRVQQIHRPQATGRADTVGKIVPKQSPFETNSINELIGAKVAPIDLTNDVARVTGPKPVTTSAGTYTMYPQAADRMQAATNIASNTSLGRSLDLRG